LLVCSKQSSSILLFKTLKTKRYKTFILPTVLYDCGIRILTIKEENKLQVFETKVLKKIFRHRTKLTQKEVT